MKTCGTGTDFSRCSYWLFMLKKRFHSFLTACYLNFEWIIKKINVVSCRPNQAPSMPACKLCVPTWYCIREATNSGTPTALNYWECSSRVTVCTYIHSRSQHTRAKNNPQFFSSITKSYFVGIQNYSWYLFSFWKIW